MRDNDVTEVSLAEGPGAEAKRLVTGHRCELWGLAVHPTASLFCTGGDDKILRVWDYGSRSYADKHTSFGHKIRCAAFSSDGACIAVGFKEGLSEGNKHPIRIVSVETMEVDCSLTAGEECISSLVYSPDGSRLAAGSWDQNAYLFDTSNNYKLLYILKGNSSSVEHVSFSMDGTLLLSNSKDAQSLYWEVGNGFRIKKTSSCRDVAFSPHTLPLGWHTRGIWDPDYEQNDVNSVCSSGEGTHMVLGDDFGNVKLMRFPCLTSHPSGCAGCVRYWGHSSHVTCVRFSSDDQWVFSTGGADSSIFQWRFVNDGQLASETHLMQPSDPTARVATEHGLAQKSMKRGEKQMGKRVAKAPSDRLEMRYSAAGRIVVLEKRKKELTTAKRLYLKAQEAHSGGAEGGESSTTTTTTAAVGKAEKSFQYAKSKYEEAKQYADETLAAEAAAGEMSTASSLTLLSDKEKAKALDKMSPEERTAALAYIGKFPASADDQKGVRVQLARAIATVYPPTGHKTKRKDYGIPNDSLELQHAYGYQGAEGRSNVAINSEGRLVYYIAGVGVVAELESKEQRHFLGHNEDITCFAMHLDKKLIATG